MNWGKLILVLVVAAAAGGAGVWYGRHQHEAGGAGVAKPAARYHCPMHPQITADKPGECPICGMDLVPIKSSADPSATTSTVSGLAVVHIPEAARQRMGLTFGTVERRNLERTLRTSARIAPEETREHHVTLKVEGWIDKLYVATTGQQVKRGEPLLELHSPELIAAAESYLAARRPGSPDAQPIAAAARQRLLYWGLSEEQVRALETSGKVGRTFTIPAPAAGWVVDKPITHGHRALAGEVLMTIADLSQVWGDANIYEAELALIRVGMPVELRLPHLPGQVFTGRISFLSPALDPVTRTLKARLEIPNADVLLKPEMFAEVRLNLPLGEQVAVPVTAVLRTGERAYVFRAAAGDQLTPVAVTLGARCGAWFAVLDGVQPGDRVVTSANFLVDSESAMQAALSAVQER
jgi:multidrug efflux pump subunit AcrA (membrane-fusion protein)